MSAVPVGRASYRWLTITLLVAGGVYAWYAIGQYNRLNDLYQRQLSNAGTDLKVALDNAVETVKQFNDKWNKSTEENRPRVCDFVRSQPYLERDDCSAGTPSDDIEWKKFTNAQAVVAPTLGIGVGGESNSLERFQYRTDRLVQELAFSESFALIFIATANGEVLYQDAPARRRWLRHLRWGEQMFRDAYPERPPMLQIHNVQQIVGGETPWNALRSVSSRTTTELGGTTHQLYLQPLVLEGAQPITLIVGGVVPRASVFREALALGAPMLGILVFLLLFGILGFPFVKLACLDLHERFCLWDITLLYVSTGALLVLFTCASLAVDGYVRWHVEADRGLEPLADRLETKFLHEIGAIGDQLSKYDGDLKAVQPCDQWDVHTNWFEQQRAGGLPWPHDVHLKTVAWIEPGGRQIWKSTGDAVPGKTWVGNRVYFRAVRENNLFHVEGKDQAIFIVPDRSIADGKFYTFISMKSRISPTLCAEVKSGGTPVIAATAQLLSLEGQLLPEGYGFALVNREGRVLYHSDSRFSLRENLYEELSEGARARAMMYSRRAGGLDTRYRERPHRFYLRPIRLSLAAGVREPQATADKPAGTGAGFYLAVFRDTSLEQELVGHVFVVGLFGPMALLLAISSMGLAFLARASRHTGHTWSVWLWPHRGLDQIYKGQVAAFLVLLLLSTGVYVWVGTVVPFLVSAVLAPVLGVFIYWCRASRTGQRRSLSPVIWQRASVLLLLVCMVVVPSATLFRLALGHEFAKLIQTERDWIEAQKEDRLRALTVEALEGRYGEARTKELAAARETYSGCVPSPFDAPEARSAAPALRTSLVNCASEASSSAVAGSSAMLRSMGMDAGAIDALAWLDGVLPVENEILARLHFRNSELEYSPDGTLVRRFRASGIAFTGFALTLGLLCWWIRWNTNRLFLADIDASAASPSGTPEEIWARCDEVEQMVLVQIAREHIANPRQRSIVKALLEKGLLRLAPDVKPFSEEFADFLRRKEQELDAKIRDWQDVKVRRSWRYGRLILVSSVAGVGFFLIATQPGLQSSVVTIATGITGVLSAGSRLRDAVASWIARKATS